MLSMYPACYFKDETGYSVIFPDLNFLATCGETSEQATAMAIDCLAGYIYTCQRDGETVPEPSPINAISVDTIADELGLELHLHEAFVSMVSVDVEQYAKANFEKAVKKTLTIPKWLNSLAVEQGVNFSQTLKEALINVLVCSDAVSWEASANPPAISEAGFSNHNKPNTLLCSLSEQIIEADAKGSSFIPTYVYSKSTDCSYQNGGLAYARLH